MKLCLICLLALASLAASNQRSGDAAEYHLDHSYVLVAYHYVQLVTRNGKTVTNSVTQFYSFNAKKMKYEQAKKP